jgi:hypothetical protein
MGRPFLIALLLLADAAVSAAAQDFLPAAFSGWSSAGARSNVHPDALEQLVGTDAAVFREYGTLGAEHRVYSRGAQTLSVTLYRMRDPTAAFGIYTYLRTAGMSAANLTPLASLSRQRALVASGNLLLDVSAGDLRPLVADLRLLVAHVAPHADRTPYPTIGQHLPPRGLVSNSERYLLGPLALGRILPLGNGDWIGFAEGAEAELARYRLDGQEATLLLAAYPTPQGAARKLEELGRWFALNAVEEQANGRPVLFARRWGSLVALVAQTRSQAVADALLQQIHYESQVTWNEPGFKLTEPTIERILVQTILGTGIILVFAAVAGIGFGGVRLLVKYLLPGKVFDRGPQVEILQLGLSSKPIEGKDFY